MISRVRIFSNCNSNAVSLLICTRRIRSSMTCVFLRVFQLGKNYEEMRCNCYYYTYLAIYRRLVVSVHQILVSFSGFSLDSGLVGAARSWCVSARYHCDGALCKRRTQDSERSTQDPVSARRSYLSKADDPIKIGAATNHLRPSPLVVSWF